MVKHFEGDCTRCRCFVKQNFVRACFAKQQFVRGLSAEAYRCRVNTSPTLSAFKNSDKFPSFNGEASDFNFEFTKDFLKDISAYRFNPYNIRMTCAFTRAVQGWDKEKKVVFIDELVG